MPNTKQDRSRVSKTQTWEVATLASKFGITQKTVREAMKHAVTKKGKPSIARINVEKVIKTMIEAVPELVKKKK